jgi:hypothetical protein
MSDHGAGVNFIFFFFWLPFLIDIFPFPLGAAQLIGHVWNQLVKRCQQCSANSTVAIYYPQLTYLCGVAPYANGKAGPFRRTNKKNSCFFFSFQPRFAYNQRVNFSTNSNSFRTKETKEKVKHIDILSALALWSRHHLLIVLY